MSMPSELSKQLSEQRRKVDFDTYDITVDELLRRLSERRIEVAPSYQRQFRWDEARQSRIVESLLLGIPIPPLFMATNSLDDVGTGWEVVDGVQRLMSLAHFTEIGSSSDSSRFALCDLEILRKFNNYSYMELPENIQRHLLDRSLKVIILNDKSDPKVRFDLFERLNTGGISLTPQELREAVYRGAFVEFLTRLSSTAEFKNSVNIGERKLDDGTPNEMVLRFFAFLDEYDNFDHSVIDFLNDYMQNAQDFTADELAKRERIFYETFGFISWLLPQGIRRGNRNQTPTNLYEAVAVGSALALQEAGANKLKSHNDPKPDWINSEELTRLTTGATNSKRAVRERIHYVRDALLSSVQ